MQSGYYKIISDCHPFDAGDLIYFHPTNDKIHAFWHDSHWTFTNEQFNKFKTHIQLEPNGTSLRQQEIAAIMATIDTTNLEIEQLHNKSIGFNPHLHNGDLSTSTAIVPTNTNMIQAKQAVATVRNTVMRAKKEIAEKSKSLNKLINEQTAIMKIKMAEMTELVGKMETAIWTINLYLGKNEEILTLRTGAAAPIDDKITIRQNILSMDEESALDPRNFGIDITSLHKFDEWLLENPANLNRVLPESKGIIALHPRSKQKRYDDPYDNATKNKANLQWTYFLIRNGENLYRIQVDIVLGKHLFPTASEFESLFMSREIDEDGNNVPLKPGSKAYMAALEASEEVQKHYLRVLLILQGLMDRTPIFKPMPTHCINLCDPSHCFEWLNLIYESENIITDNKPSFREWQKTINSQLGVGHRIIGQFDHSSGLRAKDHYEVDRIYPKGAEYPKSLQLHIIEDRATEMGEDFFAIRYNRNEEIFAKSKSRWRTGSWRTPETRARCLISKDDGFILNFDTATINELEYYQKHRLSRAHYHDMIPLLETAIQLKKDEQIEERPFKLLLIGKLISSFGISMETATAVVDELVIWWKFKNRTHRALLSDDAKAISMIINEYRLRTEQEAHRVSNATANAYIVDIIINQIPAPVYIAHKRDNQYVAYIPHNDKNVWVTEQTWIRNGTTGDLRLKESKPWKLVDKRYERWGMLYQHERWNAWRINPQLSTVLTDPEIDMLINEALQKLPGSVNNYRHNYYVDAKEESAEISVLPLFVSCDEQFEVNLWFSDFRAIIPTELIISNQSLAPGLKKVKLKWTRTINGIKLSEYLNTSGNYCSSEPWGNSSLAYRSWPDNIKLVNDDFDAVEAHKDKVNALERKYRYVVKLVTDLLYQRKIDQAQYEYNQEFGDPELWPDHLKSLKLQRIEPRFLELILNHMAERGVDPIGMTLGQVYQYGIDQDISVKEYWNGPTVGITVPADLPSSWIIPVKTENFDE